MIEQQRLYCGSITFHSVLEKCCHVLRRLQHIFPFYLVVGSVTSHLAIWVLKGNERVKHFTLLRKWVLYQCIWKNSKNIHRYVNARLVFKCWPEFNVHALLSFFNYNSNKHFNTLQPYGIIKGTSVVLFISLTAHLIKLSCLQPFESISCLHYCRNLIKRLPH